MWPWSGTTKYGPASVRPRSTICGPLTGPVRCTCTTGATKGPATSCITTVCCSRRSRSDQWLRAGIHVLPQFYLDGVGYMDLLLDGWLLVELDGRHHTDWRQVKKDHRRNNSSVVQGYAVLRYYYSDVVHAAEAMVAEVLAVLGRGKNARPAA